MNKDKIIGIVWYGSAILIIFVIALLVSFELMEKLVQWL